MFLLVTLEQLIRQVILISYLKKGLFMNFSMIKY